MNLRNLNIFNYFRNIKAIMFKAPITFRATSPVRFNSLYIKIPVANSEYVELNKTPLPIINIVMKSRAFEELPYKDLLNNNLRLKEAGIYRDNWERVTIRGDNRTIEKIHEAGGFNPNWTNTEEQDGKRDPLDVLRHRENSNGSGFVSTTVDPEEAHYYGQKFAMFAQGDPFLIENKTSFKYNIYALNAIGAMKATSTSQFLSSRETETSVPGGIDKEDIIAYRECDCQVNQDSYYTQKRLTQCSAIFFNKHFKEKYPELVEPIAKAMLIGKEALKSNRP